MYHIIAILITVLCVSCSSIPVSTSIPRITSDVTVYRQEEIEKPLTFHSDAPEVKELMALVDAKQGQWHQDIATYAPAISVQSETLRVDCQRSRVIAIFRNAIGGWVQLVAPLSASEYSRIQEMFGVAGDEKGEGKIDTLTAMVHHRQWMVWSN